MRGCAFGSKGGLLGSGVSAFSSGGSFSPTFNSVCVGDGKADISFSLYVFSSGLPWGSEIHPPHKPKRIILILLARKAHSLPPSSSSTGFPFFEKSSSPSRGSGTTHTHPSFSSTLLYSHTHTERGGRCKLLREFVSFGTYLLTLFYLTLPYFN